MKSSGLKINESKTELCLFTRNDVAAMVMSVKGVDVSTKNLVLWNRFLKKRQITLFVLSSLGSFKNQL